MNDTSKSSQLIAHLLLKNKAIQLRPDNMFQWSSGMLSPIYCDNRILLSDHDARSAVKKAFCTMLENYQFKSVAGVATAGIAHGALVADALRLPFCYVRSKAKAHGMQNMIEGRVEPGSDVVVIEDLFSTGGSSIQAAKALEAAGANVVAIGAIFTYGFTKARQAFDEAGYKTFALSDFETLIGLPEVQDNFSKENLAVLKEWYATNCK